MEESLGVYIATAEQQMKLDACDEALASIENALILQPQHPKSLFCKGKVSTDSSSSMSY